MRRMDAEEGRVEKERMGTGAVGDEIEMDSGTFDGLIESSFCRVIFRLEPEMPFAENCGGVPGVFQPLGDGDLVQRKFRDVVHGAQRTGLPIKAVNAADSIDARAGHVLAAHQRGSGRLAIRTAGLAAGKAYAIGGEPVYVRRFVILAA